MQRSIFRKVALDRLQSPEQLDQLVQRTSPTIPLDRGALGAALGSLRRRLTTPVRSGMRRQRVNTPTVLQMESVECGAAALAMVLGFYGRIVPLEELRVVCGVSRDGSKASNLIKAAHGYGLKAKGFKKEPEELRSLPLPLIAFWNFNHFVVVEGFGRDRVYLNDPGMGQRSVSFEEFDHAFTGVVLVFSPGPTFAKGGMRPTLQAALRRRLAGCETALLYIALIGVGLVLPGIIIPIAAQVFVDDVVSRGRADLIWPLLIGMALTALLRGALTWLQTAQLVRLEARLARSMGEHFFRHVLQLPVAFFTQRSPGEVAARIALNDRVARMLAGPLASSGLAAVFVVVYVLLMLHYDPLLTPIVVSAAVLNMVVVRLGVRQQTNNNRRLAHDQGQLTAQTFSALQMIETIKATGAEADVFARWTGYQAKVINTEQAMARSAQLASVAPSLLTTATTIAVFMIGGLHVIEGRLTVGMLVAFQSLMASCLQAVHQLATSGRIVQTIGNDLNRIDDVLRYPAAPHLDEAMDEQPGTHEKLTGQLELRDVTFGYSRMTLPLIQNLSLTLRPGEQVALVGGSGSGKSTVAKLVAGLYEPWSGAIMFDGQRRHDLPRSLITRSVALVDQDMFLFGGTVRDNITLWDRSVPPEDVVQAAQDAVIHGEIMTRPGEYAGMLDEGGRDLSGGQRQRLEIARALVGNPTILILDEATSALDPVTEKIVVDNIRRRGCACLVVAHRLSTIRDADQIVVLEQGQVVQRGTHAELSSVPGRYARLIAADMSQPMLDTAGTPLAPTG